MMTSSHSSSRALAMIASTGWPATMQPRLSKPASRSMLTAVFTACSACCYRAVVVHGEGRVDGQQHMQGVLAGAAVALGEGEQAGGCRGGVDGDQNRMGHGQSFGEWMAVLRSSPASRNGEPRCPQGDALPAGTAVRRRGLPTVRPHHCRFIDLYG
ncbi:hypothetical protein WR25_20967 [Diploscapter pachys]|uniref:Uncharacterized protein n=1 Tax=Diploscapter pachys TaxID=2018661 RepID=A0A2A2M416_9BILA|nr:hypothetical protein WR25_20967 [Diploscapter pachys]